MTTPSPTPMDRDQYVQEISMCTIAAGSSTIFVAQACQEAKLVLLLIAALVSAALVVKSMLYMGVITWHPGGKKKRRNDRPRPWILGQEISTALVGVVAGMYLGPVVQSLFQFDRYDYPEPLPALAFVALMLLVKAVLYSSELNYLCHSPRRRRRFLQIVATLVAGCLIGLFLYHSRWAFKPAEWWPERYQDVYEQPTALINFGGYSVRSEYQARTLSSLWQEDKARPYLEVGFVILLLCLFLKFYLYTHGPQRHGEETFAAASVRMPAARSPAKPASSASKRMSAVPSPGGSKRVSKPGDMRLGKTQEHRIPTRGGSASLARTQEHRVAPIGKTREVRMPVASAPERLLRWEPLHLLCSAGGGLLILPILSNAFWCKRAAYPYGAIWFAVVVVLGVISLLHLIELLPERKKR